MQTLAGNQAKEAQQDLVLKITRQIESFAEKAMRQDFMFTRRYSEETIAVAVIYAARKASGIL